MATCIQFKYQINSYDVLVHVIKIKSNQRIKRIRIEEITKRINLKAEDKAKPLHILQLLLSVFVRCIIFLPLIA